MIEVQSLQNQLIQKHSFAEKEADFFVSHFTERKVKKRQFIIQPDFTEQGIKILHRNGIDIWKNNLKNGAIAILLVNRSLNESNFIELDFEEINIDHVNTIWDIYEKKEMNEMTNITVRLLPHDSKFLIINR